MKKEYMKPAMRVYELQQRNHILVGSDFDTLDSDEFNYGGGDNQPGR